MTNRQNPAIHAEPTRGALGRRVPTRLVAIGAVLALFGAACASDTSSTPTSLPDAEPAADSRRVDGSAVSRTDAPTAGGASGDVDPVTTSDAEPDPVPAPARAPEPEPAAEPAPEPAPEPEPAEPCGSFGPLPPRPDSMPTVQFDTDGDGAIDDDVTAYGAVDGWRVRVVENGVTSEALVDGIDGWAHLVDPMLATDGDQIGLRDAETDVVHRFATGPDGCIVSISSSPAGSSVLVDAGSIVGPDPIDLLDDLASPTLPPDTGDGCGSLPDIPDDALIGTDLLVDYDGGGVADDRLVSYFDGTWKLRAEVSGFADEIELPDAGVHGVRVLGLANVGQIMGGDEIIAVVGGGASAVEIGVFAFHELSCLIRYQHESGDDFGLLTGAGVMWGEGIICEDGAIADWGYQREDDDTYTLWGAAYHEISPGVFGYLPASDDYVEGLSFDDLSTNLFDCDGMTI